MKKCLEILDFEEKKTKAGKSYVRFKTSDGWMSCFDSKSNEELKAQKGNAVNVEVIESGEFQNIKKFYEAASEGVEATPEKPGAVKTSNGRKEMYVSYAKDCFCAIVTRISQTRFDDFSTEEILELMDTAIAVTKKAESAF